VVLFYQALGRRYDKCPILVADIQLSKANGKKLSGGETIEYICTDTQHQNPLRRVATVSSDNNFGLNYSREKYKEMLLDAAENMLGVFRFDRTLFGKLKDKKWFN